MKKYELSISLPYKQTFSQQSTLDEILSDTRLLSYERRLQCYEDGSGLQESYSLVFYFS